MNGDGACKKKRLPRDNADRVRKWRTSKEERCTSLGDTTSALELSCFVVAEPV